VATTVYGVACCDACADRLRLDPQITATVFTPGSRSWAMIYAKGLRFWCPPHDNPLPHPDAELIPNVPHDDDYDDR
jgi:hypothetical protein